MNDPVNHATREPHQPTYAIAVEGDFEQDFLAGPNSIEYAVRLDRLGPGNVEFKLIINGRQCGTLPFDNLVKAATRIDPDHAVGPEKQIQKLRKEVSEARAEKYDWQARAEQLAEQVAQLEAKIAAFQESTKA